MATEPTDGNQARVGRTSFGYGLIVGIFVAIAAAGVWSHVMEKRDEVRMSGPALKVPTPIDVPLTTSEQSGTVKTVGGESILRLVGQNPLNIQATAPLDWSVATGPQDSLFALKSDQRSLYACWNITVVDRSKQAAFGDLYGDSQTSKIYILDSNLKAWGEPGDAQFTAKVSRPGAFYTAREWLSSTRQGVVFYHDYPNGGTNYVESVYIAAALRDQWQSKGGIAVQVATSIHAPGDLVRSKLLAYARKHLVNSNKISTDANIDIDPLYVTQLGWQTVHSKNGTNYMVDLSTDYNESGPDGPGYYIMFRKSYQRLSLGRKDLPTPPSATPVLPPKK